MKKFKFILFFFAFILISSASYAQDEYSVSINGTIIRDVINEDASSVSANGIFWCKYDIDAVTDEMRRLTNFRLYKNSDLLFTLNEIPGSDVDISNSGYVVFYDHSFHFNQKLKIHVYNSEGVKLFEKEYTGANLTGFSESGNLFGIGSPEGIEIISLADNSSINYPRGFQFAVSEDDKRTAVAYENTIEVFEGSESSIKINTGFFHTRKLIISSAQNIAAAIDKNNLNVYSLSSGQLLFTHSPEKGYSFRDLKIINGMIAAGIHYKTKTESRGEILYFDLSGNLKERKTGEQRQLINHKPYPEKESINQYDPIPWPFAPFDSMRTVWNHHEQHMGSGGASYSYLHQGLDLITPIGEPTYAVESGIVKLVLTLGGAIYWRIAISETQEPGWSDGWLYAHLIENTIQFDVGDTVQIHDYLGDIIEWSSDWGHIHFIEIRDSGLVWLYSDNEWGINFNPLLALTPLIDNTPPVIDNVFNNQKFGFCTNETSNYLNPLALTGNVDIIVKVHDYIGDSEWQQPAFKIDYWIKRISDNEIILPRRMGHILNHSYPFYEGGNYEPYATVIYKRDNILTPSSWMSTERNYHHVITNSNGDSVITLAEKNLAFNTAGFYDSEYRIYVEAFDPSGNSVIDSMDVFFNNQITENDELNKPAEFKLFQNYPNPFNPTTSISYSIAAEGNVSLTMYDMLGKQTAVLVNEYKKPGNYSIEFNGSEFSSGVYFYKLQSGAYTEIRKLVLLK